MFKVFLIIVSWFLYKDNLLCCPSGHFCSFGKLLKYIKTHTRPPSPHLLTQFVKITSKQWPLFNCPFQRHNVTRTVQIIRVKGAAVTYGARVELTVWKHSKRDCSTRFCIPPVFLKIRIQYSILHYCMWFQNFDIVWHCPIYTSQAWQDLFLHFVLTLNNIKSIWQLVTS